MGTKSNNFAKGLQMAYHPLATGVQDSFMSNALNATLITDNGNYAMLQQELGNGKVEMAYLPNGYVPLGCNEFGGVMYIVSYNPFTKKAQIGSFPSPERNITSTEDGSIPQKISWSDFFDITNGIYNTYKRLYPIGDDVTVKPGDEFLMYLIYQNNLNVNLPSIDYSSILSTVDSLGLIKVSLFSKSSNGNLVDITEVLKKVQDLDGDIDPDIPFYIKNDSDNITVDDLISSFGRGESPYVVWNMNYSGQLVASIEVETIEEFDVSIDVSKNTDQSVCSVSITPAVDDYHDELWREGVYVKDGIISLTDNGGIQYRGGVYVSCRLYNITGTYSEDKEFYTELNGNDLSVDFDISGYENSGWLFDYSITPYMYCGKIEHLTKSGTIDISKVNQGIYEVTQWRYYNENVDNQYSFVNTLNFAIDYYPKKGYKINNARLRVTKLLNYKDESSSVFYVDNAIEFTKMGSYQMMFDYNNNFEPNQLYMIEILIDELDDKGNPVSDGIDHFERIKFINTSVMYNDEFLTSENDFNKLYAKNLAYIGVNFNYRSVSQELNKFAPTNKYIAIGDDCLQNTYNTIYNRYTYSCDSTYDIDALYKLFMINANQGYNPSTIFDLGSQNPNFASTTSFENGNVASSTYVDPVINKTPVKYDDYKEVYDEFWYSVSKDDTTGLYTVVINNPINTYGDYDTKTITYDHQLVSMTDDVMADIFWGSTYENKTRKEHVYDNGRYTIRRNRYYNLQPGDPGYDEDIFIGGMMVFHQQISARFNSSTGSGSKGNTQHTPKISVAWFSRHDNNLVEWDNNYFSSMSWLLPAKGSGNEAIKDGRARLGFENTGNVYEASDSSNIWEPFHTLWNDWKIWNKVNKDSSTIRPACALLGVLGCRPIQRNTYKFFYNKEYPYTSLTGYPSEWSYKDFWYTLCAQCSSPNDPTTVVDTWYVFEDKDNIPEFWCEDFTDLYTMPDYYFCYKMVHGFDTQYDINNNIKFPQCSYNTFDGCHFLFATTPDTQFDSCDFVSDYNIFPTGIKPSDEALQYSMLGGKSTNRTPWLVGYNHATTSQPESYVQRASYINRYISHNIDFGNPVYQLFSCIYINQIVENHTVTAQCFVNNTWLNYSTVTNDVLFYMNPSDDTIAGKIMWNTNTLQPKEAMYESLKGTYSSLTSVSDVDTLILEPYGTNNITFAYSDNISATNGNIVISSNTTSVIRSNAPSSSILNSRMKYENNISCIFIDGDTIVQYDNDGNLFNSNDIYHIVNDNGSIYFENISAYNKEVLLDVDYDCQLYVKQWFNEGSKRTSIINEPIKTIHKTLSFDPARWKIGRTNDNSKNTLYIRRDYIGGLSGDDVRLLGRGSFQTFRESKVITNGVSMDVYGWDGKDHMNKRWNAYERKSDQFLKMYNILGPRK